MQVTFDHIQEETPNIKTFYFKPEKPVQYQAGQFTELTLPHDNPDDRGIKRWFTLSSPPGRDLLTITTKFAPENGSTFKKTLAALEPGAKLDFADPMGDFVLPKQADIPLLFIAGGMGITPYHSILEWLADNSESRQISLLYAVRDESEIVFQDTFERAGVKPIIIVGEPSHNWQGETGRLSVERIKELAQPAENARIYVSGPEPMVEAFESALPEAGFNKDQLVFDFFPGYLNDYSS